MSYENILVDIEDGVGTITLNRPESLNAMNRKLSAEMHDRSGRSIPTMRSGCIVLTGAGRAFSAGGDIHEQRDDDRRYTFEQLEAMRGGRRAYDVSAARKPIMGMMNGLAYGGAAVLASSLDMRIGCEHTKFRFLAAAYGRINSTWSLGAQIGWPMAKELLFTARVVEAEEAYRIGLLNHLVPRDKLRDKDNGDRPHDRQQPSRRGDGREGAIARAEGRKPGTCLRDRAALHHARNARRQGRGRLP